MPLTLARSALAALTVAAATTFALQPSATAATSGSLTGLGVEYDYLIAQAADGCTKSSSSSIQMSAPGKGKAFAATEYQAGWVVTLDVSTPDGEVLDSLSTQDAYTSTYEQAALHLTLTCKPIKRLLSLGYGAGEQLQLSITSAIYEDGDHVLDTSDATTSFVPKRVVSVEPQKATKTSVGYRIKSRATLWSSVEDGYAWAEPDMGVPVTGLWKGCPSRTVTTKDDGTFTVTWKKSALLDRKNFGYGVAESKKLGFFAGGWTIKRAEKFIPTDRYYNGCGGARAARKAPPTPSGP